MKRSLKILGKYFLGALNKMLGYAVRFMDLHFYKYLTEIRTVIYPVNVLACDD